MLCIEYIDSETGVNYGIWEECGILACTRCEACQKHDHQLCDWPNKENGDFIAHAREDVPKMLDHIAEQQREIQRLKAELKRKEG